MNVFSQPNSPFGRGGVLSCWRKAPKYVLGAYCRGNLVRSTRNATKNATAMSKDGTSVETSDEAEAGASRVDPTFASSFGFVFTSTDAVSSHHGMSIY